MNTTQVIPLLVSLALSTFLLAEDVPDYGFPQNETVAKSLAVSQLLAKHCRTLHQVCAVVLKQSGTITIEEIWIDLPTNEYKLLVRSVKTDDLKKNPLANLDHLLETTPHHGFWKTSYGAMKFRPEDGQWDPITLHTGVEMRNYLKRIKKEWYLWPGSAVNIGCCGQPSSVDPNQLAAQIKLYDAILKHMASGLDTTELREEDGLIREIRVKEGGQSDVLVKRVTNEYMQESPIALDAKAGEELRKRSNIAPFPFAKSLPFPKGPNSYGVLFGSGADGTFIRGVQEKSVAARAGVAPGDQVLAVNGKMLSEKGNDPVALIQNSTSMHILLKRQDGSNYGVTISRGDWGDGSWRQ